MNMKSLLMDAYDSFANGWALVSAGSLDDHNSMTVSWGGVGCLWGFRGEDELKQAGAHFLAAQPLDILNCL